MKEGTGPGTILCQPDGKKGCSICCGLYNFTDVRRDSLAEFLRDGVSREQSMETHEDFQSPLNVRDRFSHICPFQGFLTMGKPGCLVHPLAAGSDGRGRSLFANRICGEFFCPAHWLLSENEKRFLIEHVDDWYHYSTAILDPDSFSYILSYASEKSRGGKTAGHTAEAVKSALDAHAENLSEYKGTLFFYSIPEYNLSKRGFSIKYNSQAEEKVLSRIDSFFGSL